MGIPRDHIDIVRAFNQERVVYIVVNSDDGGTGELYLGVRPDIENANKALEAVRRIDVEPPFDSAEGYLRRGQHWAIHGMPRGSEPATCVHIVLEDTVDVFDEEFAAAEVSLLGRHTVRRLRQPAETSVATS
ncbi:MAG: hypothetical protein AAGD10_10600 [Myxococcota bacterium]